MKNLNYLAAAFLAFTLSASPLQANEYKLPDLGGASTGLVSPAQERELGQDWLRLFRSRVETSSDPLIIDYTEKLLSKLSRHTELHGDPLDLVIVPNPTINAFAVPGGVIGVHTGLFSQAESEHQLATVLAHELAHLSQRHFARKVHQQKSQSIPMMAATLATLVIAATSGAEAGLAAATASQAAAADSRLRFSRQYEKEADRVGMRTLQEAGYDPYASAEMFEIMLRATRYSRRPPEFLLTHPVTEKRIADARNRALKYKQRDFPQSLDFHLMRARTRLLHEESPQVAVKRFSAELTGDTLSVDASRYGLAMAYRDTGQVKQARATLAPLLEKAPYHEGYNILAAEIDSTDRNYSRAISRLEEQLRKAPNSYPLNMTYADILMKANRHEDSETILVRLSRQRPKDANVWYMLAEVHGLAGNILGVHRARAEYFVLNGVFDRARRDLNHALKLVEDNYPLTALLEERLKQVQRLQEKSQL